MSALRIAIVGLGKIARKEHMPAISASSRFSLVAAVDPVGSAQNVPVYRNLASFLDSGIAADALAMCQPPQYRHDAAYLALRAGKHVLLEKPPGVSVAQVQELTELASASARTLFVAWHSRYAAGVEPARAWLAGRRIERIRILWKENVREWHPGQQWIWEPGGFGVFDAGINALSILTRLVPGLPRLKDGTLEVPENRATPLAARLELVLAAGIPIDAQFDFLQEGPPRWEISIDTDAGELALTAGGAALEICGQIHPLGAECEYRALYERFAQLIDAGSSDADLAPLAVVDDAWAHCGRRTVQAFTD